ncbi:hypothetical protein [Terrilactibacillus tamarindi]|nr:hypothetical protein [Terrilactibacillus tamarindi]
MALSLTEVAQLRFQAAQSLLVAAQFPNEGPQFLRCNYTKVF